MPSVRLIVFGCAALLAGIGAQTQRSAAQATCEMYGKLAVQQQQANAEAGCGFTGDEWSSDLKRHVDWCGSVPPDQWKVELQKREQALDACKTEKGD